MSNSYECFENQPNYINEKNPIMYKERVLVSGAAVTNYHRPSDLNKKHSFPSVLEPGEAETRVWAWVGCSESLSQVSSAGGEREGKEASSNVSSSYLSADLTHEGFTLLTSLSPNTSPPNTIILGGLNVNIWILGEFKHLGDNRKHTKIPTALSPLEAWIK